MALQGKKAQSKIMAASSSSSSSSSSKPTSFNQKLFTISLLLLSSSILLFVLSFKPKLQLQQQQSYKGNLRPKKQPNNHNNDHLLLKHRPKWLHVIGNHIKDKRIKVGLVNMNHSEEENGSYYSVRDKHVEAVHVNFERVGDDKKWEDFFPGWIDEDHEWGPPRCPEMPVAKPEEEYRDLDVIVARVPCGGGGVVDNERKGIRDVFRLQVNLVVANLAVESGEWVKKEKKKMNTDDDDDDRTVYVVFVGKCGAMMEIFRCDDLVENVGDYWIYKPDLRKLKQKVLMPVGSCQIARTTGEFLFVF